MHVAVMSDIHGFSLALKAVLVDIEAHGPFDAIVVAGDLCEVGPAPDEVLDILSGLPAKVVQGNTDRDLADGVYASVTANFARQRIGQDGIRYLAGLPFAVRITPLGTRGRADDLLVVHANPMDLDRPIPPDAGDRELRELIGDTEAAAIAFGHLHVCYRREALGKLLVDVSAVGNPKDEDLRCKWGEFTWNVVSGGWTAELHKIPYPLTETIEQMMQSGMPKPEKAIAKLKRASYS